jgi:hypothetical protein
MPPSHRRARADRCEPRPREDEEGHRVCADGVSDLPREEGFSLQGNAKTMEGRQHPNRDGQFRYINEQARAFQQAGDPVISVDCKKKELVGPGVVTLVGRGGMVLWLVVSGWDRSCRPRCRRTRGTGTRSR